MEISKPEYKIYQSHPFMNTAVNIISIILYANMPRFLQINW